MVQCFLISLIGVEKSMVYDPNFLVHMVRAEELIGYLM